MSALTIVCYLWSCFLVKKHRRHLYLNAFRLIIRYLYMWICLSPFHRKNTIETIKVQVNIFFFIFVFYIKIYKRISWPWHNRTSLNNYRYTYIYLFTIIQQESKFIQIYWKKKKQNSLLSNNTSYLIALNVFLSPHAINQYNFFFEF